MITINDFVQSPYALPLAQLGKLLPQEKVLPPAPSPRPLDKWQMEIDDAPIFKFLYQTQKPRRHLEFGTWQGWGTTLCLESCDTTVWTLNLPDGESRPDGTWAYSQHVIDTTTALMNVVSAKYGLNDQEPIVYHRTDAGGYVGHLYKEKNLGHRVCQVYCDSRDWDISNYPSDFFDSVLIDGGHLPEVVINDTRKALQVLRPGGLMMWHDFCPVPEIRSQFESVKGVTAGIEQILPELIQQLKNIHWINPSWILIGIKK